MHGAVFGLDSASISLCRGARRVAGAGERGRGSMIIAQAGAPPDTAAYYHVAYAWAVAVYVGYLAKFWSRVRRARSLLAAWEGGGARARRETYRARRLGRDG